MKESTFFKNDKTQDIRMMTDFKDELERIKQKLAKDFSKYSELEKMKNKQKISGKALIFRKKEEDTSKKLDRRKTFANVNILKNRHSVAKPKKNQRVSFSYSKISHN